MSKALRKVHATIAFAEGITDMITACTIDEIKEDSEFYPLIENIKQAIEKARSAWDKIDIKDYLKVLDLIPKTQEMFPRQVSVPCLLSFVIGSLDDLYKILKNDYKKTVISNLIYLFTHLYSLFLKYEDEVLEDIELADINIGVLKEV